MFLFVLSELDIWPSLWPVKFFWFCSMEWGAPEMSRTIMALKKEQGMENNSQWYTPSSNWSHIFDRKWRSRMGFCGSFKIGGMCEACSAAAWGNECRHLEGHESNAIGEITACKEAPECLWNISLAGVCSAILSHSSWVPLFTTPWTIARHAPLSMEFPRQENCSGLLFPSSYVLPCDEILNSILWTFESAVPLPYVCKHLLYKDKLLIPAWIQGNCPRILSLCFSWPSGTLILLQLPI